MRCFVERIASIGLVLLLALLVADCATSGPSTVNVQPPVVKSVQNEKRISLPFDEIWDTLVAELSKGAYVINSIDRASGIINVSFSSDSPELYVDCGTTHRTYKRGREGVKYTYPTAGSAVFKYGDTVGNRKQLSRTVLFNRRVFLESRATVHIAPAPQGTVVTVNGRYTLRINTTGAYTVEDEDGNLLQTAQMSPATSIITLDTKQEYKGDLGAPGNPMPVTCHATGKLEQDILDMLR